MTIRVDGRSGRRRMVRSWRTVVLTGAAAFTVLLAQHTTTAAFTAQTGDTGNSAATATTFCTSPGSSTITTGEDTVSNGTAGQTNTPNGSATSMPVGTSAAAAGYGFVRFDLPSLPARCTITAATLRLYASTSQAATMEIYRAATAWSAATLTWNNQPTTAGTAVSLAVPGTVGQQSFSVQAHVAAMYPLTGNYGFLIRDVLPSGGATRYQTYISFDNGTVAQRPKLDITWG